MNIEKIIDFNGDFNKASEVLQNTFLPLGFQIVNKYENSIEMEGTGSIINKNQNILAGISWIHLQKENNSLILKADFGKIKKTLKFITIFSIIFDMIMILFVSIVMIKNQAPIQIIILIPAIMIVGLITSIPMMYFMFKNNTVKAIDTIAQNIIVS